MVRIVQRLCQECDAVIPPQQGSARPRLYCTDCRPPRGQRNPRLVDLPQQSSLEEFYRQRLDDAGMTNEAEAQQVLFLARLLDAGQHTASGAAALSRELRAAMLAAVKDVPDAVDAVDELAARRDRKATGA